MLIKMVTSYSVLLIVSSLSLISANKNDSLRLDHKIWSICNSGGSCTCGNDVGRTVRCDENDEFIHIQPCFCMYYDQKRNQSLLGNCMPTCYFISQYYSVQRYSVENATLFNQMVCGSPSGMEKSHREGRFCGRCQKNYGLAVYSYHYTTCIPCSNYGIRNWIKYFAVALLPLTLFYFLVATMRFNATSSRLNGVLCILQCVLSPIQLRMYDGMLYAQLRVTKPNLTVLTHVVTNIFGPVNLDFLRDIYPYFCLHPRLTVLHVIALDYIIAFYPFLLILLTYVLVTMYDSNYSVIVWAWKPFRWCSKRFVHHFNVKTSLIETFSTFILLSNVKILSVSIDILGLTRVYDASGTKLKRTFLYYDANIEYLGHEHLPFVALALSAGILFSIIPFLLMLVYPCRCFQRCLNYLGWRCQALHVFMDAFQGSYKTKPCDLRYFSAYYFFLRFLILLITSAVASLFYLSVLSVVMIVSAVIFAIFQPYKIDNHNKLDIVSMLLVALSYGAAIGNIITTYNDFHQLVASQVLLVSSASILCIYLVGVLIWRPCTKLLYRVYKRRRNEDSNLLGSIEVFDRDDKRYPPLLSSRDS